MRLRPSEFKEEAYLVKQLVQAFAGLVYGYDGRHPSGIRGNTKSLYELQSC